MTTRRERVVLELEDNFSSGMARAAAAAALLDSQLNDLDGSGSRVSKTMPKAADGTDDLGRSSRRTSSDINQLTGRVALLARVGATVGPAFAPISAVAVAGIAGLASQVGFATTGALSMVVAFQGVGDALKAVNDAALDPTTANLEKAAIAMERIGPDAQAFVQRFQELRPVLTDIRDSSAAGWFPGLTEGLTSLERIGPEVADLFEKIGRTGGDLVAQGAAAFSGPYWADFRQFVATEAPRVLDDLGRTLGNVARGMAELWQAFGPLNRDFSSWLLESSRAFADWSDGLSRTEGFQDFVDYIRDSGPRVADALGALGSALIEIVEAVAPLGGPSLKIIETFADLIGTIADSNIGTPLLAGVAALAAWNRTMAVTAGLQTRMGFGTAAAKGGLIAGLIGPNPERSRAALAGMRADVSSIGAVWATAGARTEREQNRLSASYRSLTRNATAYGREAAKVAAPVAGLAVASGALGDSLAQSNTATFAMYGAIAGPWGSAVGGAIGLAKDFAAGNDDVTDSLERLASMLDSGAGIADLNAGLEQARANLNALTANENMSSGDFFRNWIGLDGAQGVQDNIAGLKGTIEGIFGDSDAEEAAREFNELAGRVADAEKATRNYDAAQKRLTAESRMSEWARGAAGGMYSLSEAIKAPELSLDDLQRRMRKQGEAAANMGRNIAKAIENGANPDAIKQLVDELGADAGRALRQLANGGEDAARKFNRSFRQTKNGTDFLASNLDDLANKVTRFPGLDLEIGINGLAQVEAAIGHLTRPRLVQITTTTNANLADAYVNGQADGGTVPGQRHPYGDKVLTYLAPGEEVITNRNGEADRFRRDRALGLIPAYADGGTVQSLATGGTVTGYSGADLASMGLRSLTRALKESEKAIEREKNQRTDALNKMTDLRSTVTGNLRSSLFDQSSPWTSGALGGSVASANAILRGDIRTGREFTADVAALKGMGLNGDALADLLANATPEQVDMFANSSAADVREYQRLYNVRASVSSATGRAAGDAYGAATAQEVKALNTRVDRLTAALRDEHRKDRAASKRGASGAARNRKRG